MTQPFDVIGKTVPKRDGAEKVTGRTRYLHDLVLPRLAHGKILRARFPHARIARIDTSRARALPGVLAVLTGDDVEPQPFGFAKDQVALKRRKVRCIRDEVAAVAAETPDLAAALGITGDRVRVLQPPIGGNFGRGLDLYPIDVIAALLARRVRRPVKIEFDRVEEFIACPTREPCAIRLRTAADRDGRLLARAAHVMIDNGAYTSWGSTTPSVMLSTVAGLYRVPNVRFDTTIAYTNNPYSGSMRGYGNPESTFAVESQMDELAERLGIDPLELRRRNVSKAGDVNPQGFVLTSFAMAECLEAAAAAIRHDVPPPRPGWTRGLGYAGMFHVGGGARIYRSDGCGAIVKLDDFGKVSVITGATEIGQGSETVLAMIVAETLGVPLERVEVVNSDTTVKPWDVGAHASRTTFIAGNAARMAAEKLRGDLLAMAAEQLDEPVERLAIDAGAIFVAAEPQRRLPYERGARGGHYQPGGRTLVAEAFYDPPTTMLDKDLRGNVSASYAFAAQAVVLDVEEATGAIRVRRVVSAHDVGRALNPLAAEGQIHGGIHMGLGYALAERLVVENGQVLTASFMDYAILRADDMPELMVRLIESHEAEGPFGAKGLGESGVIPVSAAVANAVHDAIGVRFAELPITAARVREALTGPRGR